MKLYLVFLSLIWSGCLNAAQSAESAATVELEVQGKPVALNESGLVPLREQALRLVRSSNFHSDPGDEHHLFNLRTVQSDYRQTIAGKFLLVAFAAPQKVATPGGAITVVEIVVGLNRGDYASSLFTIDESGRVIGHSKYSGDVCVEILKTLKHFDPDA